MHDLESLIIVIWLELSGHRLHHQIWPAVINHSGEVWQLPGGLIKLGLGRQGQVSYTQIRLANLLVSTLT